tara:strand:+ start:558 stop:824 length:267 start_codon:yes stop_codon:yes gene_type:complete
LVDSIIITLLLVLNLFIVILLVGRGLLKKEALPEKIDILNERVKILSSKIDHLDKRIDSQDKKIENIESIIAIIANSQYFLHPEDYSN